MTARTQRYVPANDEAGLMCELEGILSRGGQGFFTVPCSGCAAEVALEAEVFLSLAEHNVTRVFCGQCPKSIARVQDTSGNTGPLP